DLALDRAVDRRRYVGAPHAREAALGGARGDGDVESTGGSALSIDEPYFAHLISQRANLVDDTHLLCDVVPDSPEVDDVASLPEPRRLFDEQHFVAQPVQPVSESRTGDADAVDDDSQKNPLRCHARRATAVRPRRYSLRSC